MGVDPVATRYASACFETAKEEDAAPQTLEQLVVIGALLRDHPDLRQFLWNPDVDPSEKVGLLDRVLKGSWSPLVRAFVQMVVAMGRAEHLSEIVEAFQEACDKEEGRLRVMVRAARPLSATLLKRLRTDLERREGKQITLQTEVAPELLGGVQILLDHRVIDGSVQRQVEELRECLMSVRVY